jgi:alginate O-acetyltransferase complex protein AlgI
LPGDWALVGGSFAVIFLFPNSIELLRRYRPGIRTWQNSSATPSAMAFVWRPNLIWAAVMIVLVTTTLLQINRERPFIYMGF